MAKIVVLATGGTIASTREASPGATATEGVTTLLGGVDGGRHEVTGRDVMTRGSYLLNHRDLRTIAETVAATLREDDVDAVVLTHGTDTMEETAYLLDLVHDSDKPVVLTGAQRTFDDLGYDGEINLDEAIAVAGSPHARGCGVLLVFGGAIYPARGVRKLHTTAPAPFGGAGPIGVTARGEVVVHAVPRRARALPLPTESFDATRVDVVVSHPGADAALARAAVAAGARGVILVGTGAGNGNHALCDWAGEAVADEIAVGISTRTVGGPVLPLYGNGGAADLLAAGAVSVGDLPWPQARILLSCLVAAGRPVTTETLADYL